MVTRCPELEKLGEFIHREIGLAKQIPKSPLGQFVVVGNFPQTRSLSSLKVELGVAAFQPANDAGVQVGVSLESDSHGAPVADG